MVTDRVHRPSPRKTALAVLALIVFAAVIAGAWYFSRSAAPSNGSGALRMAQGQQSLGLTALSSPRAIADVAFEDAAGREHALAEFRGKSVLLNIWATWCGPCRNEMPALDRLQAQLGGDDFQVVALSIDRGGVAAVKSFYDEIDIKALAIFVDPTAEAQARLGIVGVPTTLLVDPAGREVARYTGPVEWDQPGVVATIRRYLPLRKP